MVDHSLAFPSTNNFFDGRCGDLWKSLVQGPFFWNIHDAIDGPQTELGQHPCKKWLWKVLIQVWVGWKLSDLTTLKLLNRVIGDVELAPCSRLVFFTLLGLDAHQ